MVRDHRYITAKRLIVAGYTKTFTQILESVPKSVIIKDLGTARVTFNKMLKNPRLFSYDDTFRLAALLDIEPELMNKLILEECLQNKPLKKKK